ncbi:MAG: hypothetical protein ABJE95_11620 [Byssovorax sp.]
MITTERPIANAFDLQGKQLHVSYTTSGIDGKAHFNYHDAHQTLSFRGDEIRTVETEIGTLVSVFIKRTVDLGSTTFSILIPTTNLDATRTAPIATRGITTIHKFSIIQAFNHGQTEIYSTVILNGTARAVVF